MQSQSGEYSKSILNKYNYKIKSIYLYINLKEVIHLYLTKFIIKNRFAKKNFKLSQNLTEKVLLLT